MAPGVVAAYAGDEEPWIEAVPLRGEAQLAYARRLTGSADNLPALLVANGGKKLLAGHAVEGAVPPREPATSSSSSCARCSPATGWR